MIVITGATGHLGRLVIQNLLKTVPAQEIVAAVRDPKRAEDLAELGLQVRVADYDQPATLAQAFQGADKLLLISSNAIGQRFRQHQAVIDAAQQAGVKLLVYTSILHAEASPLTLAREHQATEAYLKAAGLPFVLLRNGWYTENYAGSIAPALQFGVYPGSAGAGRIASAARTDYAQAAATVLTAPDQAGKIYELAGDEAYTLAEFAAEISRQSGKPVSYQDLPEAAFREVLLKAGLPEGLASLLAQSDTGAAQGGLFDDRHQLSALIGRPTTPFAAVIQAALR